MSNFSIDLLEVKLSSPDSLEDASQLAGVLSELFPEQVEEATVLCKLLGSGYVDKLKSILAANSGTLPSAKARELTRNFYSLTGFDKKMIEDSLQCWVEVLTPQEVDELDRVDLIPVKNSDASLFENADILEEILKKVYRRDTQGCLVVCALLRNNDVQQLSDLASSSGGQLTIERLEEFSQQLKDHLNFDSELIKRGLLAWCQVLDIKVQELSPSDSKADSLPGCLSIIAGPKPLVHWTLALALVLSLGMWVGLSRDKNLEKSEAMRSRQATLTANTSLTQTKDRLIIDMPNQSKMILIYCKPGSFMMGSPKGELGRRDNENHHQVTISKGFYLGQFEVTQEQYKALIDDNSGRFDRDTYPVGSLDGYDVDRFCQLLNDFVGKSLPGYKFSLPSEAQWEYACRAGSQSALYSGQELTGETGNCVSLDKLAWYASNSNNSSHQVGQKTPNAWGFYDMYGNVSEWCSDYYVGKLSGQAVDPLNKTKSSRGFVVRGGFFNSEAGNCRSAYRDFEKGRESHPSLGFRLAAVPEN